MDDILEQKESNLAKEKIYALDIPPSVTNQIGFIQLFHIIFCCVIFMLLPIHYLCLIKDYYVNRPFCECSVNLFNLYFKNEFRKTCWSMTNPLALSAEKAKRGRCAIHQPYRFL